MSDERLGAKLWAALANRAIFASFDIDSFYPSITESLLSKAISYAKNYATTSDRDIDMIMQIAFFDNENKNENKKKQHV